MIYLICPLDGLDHDTSDVSEVDHDLSDLSCIIKIMICLICPT